MSGIRWNEICDEDKKRIKMDFPISLLNDLIRYENGFVMPRYFAENLEEKIYNFELREDDIWIVTYPKSGTTWTLELVWMLINDVELEKGKVPLSVRSPCIEVQCLRRFDFFKSIGAAPSDPRVIEVETDAIQFLNNIKGRRVIKTHLPYEFLPPKLLDTCKVVYVARNPKDVAVSFYHHNLNVPGHGYVGSFEQFLTYFEQGLHVFGSYWHHVLTGWQHRSHRNVKFLWYEDMKADMKTVIKDLCVFFEHPLSEEQESSLYHHVQFDNMKKNPFANPGAAKEDLPPEKNFMRKGQVGDWKNYFDKENNEKWENWIAEMIKGTGLEKIEHLRHI